MPRVWKYPKGDERRTYELCKTKVQALYTTQTIVNMTYSKDQLENIKKSAINAHQINRLDDRWLQVINILANDLISQDEKT